MPLGWPIGPGKHQYCTNSFVILLQTIGKIVPNTISACTRLFEPGIQLRRLLLPDDFSERPGQANGGYQLGLLKLILNNKFSSSSVRFSGRLIIELVTLRKDGGNCVGSLYRKPPG
jgi:hypothetical protein